mgnify:CR=1 FL=1
MLIAMGLKLLAKKCYGFSPSLYSYIYFLSNFLKFRTSDGRCPTPEHFVARGSEIVSYVAVSVPNEKE